MTDFVDHLILFTPELEVGCDLVEARLGTRPVTGGRHPDLGTHNALIGLGPSCYLEVMAPDPDNPSPADPVAMGLGEILAPRLITWVMRTESIEAVRAAAPDVGLGPVQHGHRDNPDGSRVAWRVTAPFVFPCDGVLPFLIAWGDTPQPGSRLPSAGRLHDLALRHPDVDAVRHGLGQLGVNLPVVPSAAPGLCATIETARGVVELV